jgi:hypothetical protein
MKTRNGFISNSSSTSFVVAIRNLTIKEELISPSDAFRLCIKENDLLWWGPADDFLENESFYIKDLEKSEKLVMERLQFYERVMKDPALLEMAEEIGRVMREDEIEGRSQRLQLTKPLKPQTITQSITRPQTVTMWEFSLSGENEKLKRKLKTVRESIENLRAIISEVEKFTRNWDIVELKLDNMDSGTPHRMEILEKKGDLIILRKEHVS